MMIRWFLALDKVLRGETTAPDAIQRGSISLPLRGLSFVGLLLAMAYGACMGSYSLFKEVDPALQDDRYWQLLATTVKVPALFFLTLMITFPSLYVFNALVGSRLTLISVLRLLIAALGVNLAVLASLGPIVAFFSVSTRSYHFMVIFNVVIFALAGLLGLAFLVQTLNRMSLVGRTPPPPPPPGMVPGEESEDASADDFPGEPRVTSDDNPRDPNTSDSAQARSQEPPGALDAIEGHVLGRHVKLVFRCWIFVFGLVGAQMGWVLRPFLGDPEMPFSWFRERESNFFQAVWMSLVNLFTGG